MIDVLLEKTFSAANEKKVESIIICGGVAANSSLRKQFQLQAEKMSLTLHIPDPSLCTDNAAMIAAAAYYQIKMDNSPSNLELDACATIAV